MNAIITVKNVASTLVTTWWTPVFIAIFIFVAGYAFWPSNKDMFDAASKLPLREE